MIWTLSTQHFNNVQGTFEGEIQHGVPHGRGIFQSDCISPQDNLVYYKGMWKSGVFDGHGFLKEVQINEYISYTYDGQWCNGKYHGYGTYTVLTNKEFSDYNRDHNVQFNTHTGEWNDNARHGTGQSVFGDFPLPYYRDETIVDLIEMGFVQSADTQRVFGKTDGCWNHNILCHQHNTLQTTSL